MGGRESVQQVAQAEPSFGLTSIDWWTYAANAALGTWLLAALIALPFQAFGTHYLKFKLPVTMNDDLRSFLIQWIAVAIYAVIFLPFFLLFQGFTWHNAGVGLGLGFLLGWVLPIGYQQYMRRKYVKRPELLDKFSADHRAQKMRASWGTDGSLRIKQGDEKTRVIKPEDITGSKP